MLVKICQPFLFWWDCNTELKELGIRWGRQTRLLPHPVAHHRLPCSVSLPYRAGVMSFFLSFPRPSCYVLSFLLPEIPHSHPPSTTMDSSLSSSFPEQFIFLLYHPHFSFWVLSGGIFLTRHTKFFENDEPVSSCPLVSLCALNIKQRILNFF